ncbi:MAG: hypothetical protein HYU41_12785 [Candidatus Rokubacteria bacterium]|nr:hypothetical protein [Candidatus Rokubacteria bacterium]
MWRWAALCVATLVAYPVAMTPSKPVAIVAGVVGLVCGLGLLLRSTPVMTAGVGLALGEYTVALMLSGRAPRLGSAVVVSVLVVLVLQTADFDRRFRRVTLGAGVLGSQLRHWAGSATLGGTAAVGLVTGAVFVTGAIRVPWAPVLAAVGALAAVVAAGVALRRALASAA